MLVFQICKTTLFSFEVGPTILKFLFFIFHFFVICILLHFHSRFQIKMWNRIKQVPKIKWNLQFGCFSACLFWQNFRQCYVRPGFDSRHLTRPWKATSSCPSTCPTPACPIRSFTSSRSRPEIDCPSFRSPSDWLPVPSSFLAESLFMEGLTKLF